MAAIDTTNCTNPADMLRNVPLGLSAVLTAVMLGSLLWFSRYGIDYTDESFYLVWISNPFNYPVSVTQFGFIYHPLYWLLGGSVSALRQANIIIIFGLAWAVCNLFLKRLISESLVPRFVLLTISASIATSSLVVLVFAGSWLPTPSYNTLAFKGLLLITMGLLLVDKFTLRQSIFGWVSIGFGGWLAFMGKPTTAAFAGLVVTTYVLAADKLKVRMIIAPLIFFLFLVLSALAIDGSIITFVERYNGRMELLALLGAGHSDALWRLGEFQLQRATTEMFWIAVLTTVAGFFISLFSRARSGLIVSAMQVLILVMGLVSVYRIPGLTGTPDIFQNLLLGSVLLAAIPIGIATLTSSGFFASALPVTHWVWALPFIGFPYAYALGTGDNYWIPISNAGLFLVLLALVFLSHLAAGKEFPRLVLTLAIVVQVISATLLVKGLESPYRQPSPLWKNDHPMDFGQSGGRLVLAQSSGKHISAAREIASQANFPRGTPMIDFTGRSPGVLYLLGANSVGLAWTLGGYPGSAQVVERALKSVPCEQLAEAWLFTEPKGPRPIPESVLASFGASLLDHFEIAGTLISPEGHTQKFFRPTRSKGAATAACENKRAKP
jgi:hypothetical protein